MPRVQGNKFDVKYEWMTARNDFIQRHNLFWAHFGWFNLSNPFKSFFFFKKRFYVNYYFVFTCWTTLRKIAKWQCSHKYKASTRYTRKMLEYICFMLCWRDILKDCNLIWVQSGARLLDGKLFIRYHVCFVEWTTETNSLLSKRKRIN